MKLYLCYCKDCNEYFIGNEIRHRMDYCPFCKINAVDIEKDSARTIGNCNIIQEIFI